VIAVVHLVWGPLGTPSLREFVASYRRWDAGTEHQLVVLFNGVDPGRRALFEAELDGVEHRPLTLAEPVQDLAAYAQAAALLEHDRLCFLNSHSQVLIHGWLANLTDALAQPGVGIVGATGSWASVRSGTLNGLFLPNPYRGVVPARRVAREQLLAIELERGGKEVEPAAQPRRSLWGSLGATLATLPAMPEQLLRFEGFPARHLRTNAFMLERELLAGLQIGRVKRKMDAYLLESGRHSLTRQIRGRGLRTVVVARDGALYDPEEWPASRTLWQGEQEGLMIADNQTRMYANGGIDRRRLLSTFAWGRQADPRAPACGETV
jgi:hypothetical protein